MTIPDLAKHHDLLPEKRLLELLAEESRPDVRRALLELSHLRSVTGELDAALAELRKRLKEWNEVGEQLLKEVKRPL